MNVSPPAPSQLSGLCIAFLYAQKSDGTPSLGTEVIFSIYPGGRPVAYNTNFSGVGVELSGVSMLIDKVIAVRTDINGLAQASLPRNDYMIPNSTQWKISVPSANFSFVQSLVGPLFNIGQLIN
jgi:hypothetical protein